MCSLAVVAFMYVKGQNEQAWMITWCRERYQTDRGQGQGFVQAFFIDSNRRWTNDSNPYSCNAPPRRPPPPNFNVIARLEGQAGWTNYIKPG